MCLLVDENLQLSHISSLTHWWMLVPVSVPMQILTHKFIFLYDRHAEKLTQERMKFD